MLARLAVFADPWPGAVAIWQFGRRAELCAAPVLALAPTIDGRDARRSAGRADRALAQCGVSACSFMAARLPRVSDDAVFAGANAAALQRADGAWEVIQFANAELVGERTYLLSRLLRGQAGSEWAMASPLAAGAPFVLLDANLVTIASGLDALERTLQLRVVAAGRDIGDADARWRLPRRRRRPRCRPLAPVHVKAARGGERRDLHLDPPHAHRRRQLGRRGAARRGQRAIRRRYPVRRATWCAR